MKSRPPSSTTLCFCFALALGACGGGEEPFVEPAIADSDEMLSASMTAKEKIGKADGWDPRDDEASYAFTAPPGDVARFPGEFEDVQTVFVAWSEGAADLRPFFVELIGAAAPNVPELVVLVEEEGSANQLYWALVDAGHQVDNVRFNIAPLDTIWMRDYGPLFARTQAGGTRIVDFRYFWGRFMDDVIPTRLASWYEMPVSRPPLELEGGNFQSDGAGRCITTSYAVEANAERGYGAGDIERIFADYFGCQVTTVLPPLQGEGTGHVDMLATITGPAEVIVGDYAEADDAFNAARLDDAAAMLESNGFLVRRVPMPGNGDGAFRSYTNSLAVGQAVLVPVYEDDTRFEAEALQTFQAAYPGRSIVPIDATEVIQWAGAVHCVTMSMAR